MSRRPGLRLFFVSLLILFLEHHLAAARRRLAEQR